MVTKYSPVVLRKLLFVEESTEYSGYSQQYVYRPVKDGKASWFESSSIQVDRQANSRFVFREYSPKN